MPQPIFNIIYGTGLDAENMESIKNTTTNVEKIRNAFKKNGKIRS